MRSLSLDEVLELHEKVLQRSGGSSGVRDEGALESALAQPQMSFGGQELYPTLAEKAAALSFSLINNHPFVDGNKRIGHAAAEVFSSSTATKFAPMSMKRNALFSPSHLVKTSRDEWTNWLRDHLVPYST